MTPGMASYVGKTKIRERPGIMIIPRGDAVLRNGPDPHWS